MNIKYVKVDGKDLPVKWNPRAKSNWEKETGLIWSKLFDVNDRVIPTTEQSMVVILEALREGHRRDKKKFNITLDDVYDWADDYDLEDQVTNIIFGKDEAEKKE